MPSQSTYRIRYVLLVVVLAQDMAWQITRGNQSPNSLL